VVMGSIGKGNEVRSVLRGGVEGEGFAREEEERDLTWKVVGPVVSGGAPGGADGAESDVVGVTGYACRDGDYQIRRKVLPISHDFRNY
jgi:hypothetical protein